jgi:hypothetical protein
VGDYVNKGMNDLGRGGNLGKFIPFSNLKMIEREFLSLDTRQQIIERLSYVHDNKKN